MRGVYAAVLIAALGCGDDDGGIDAALDAPVDRGRDVQLDVSADAVLDVASDTSLDEGQDEGRDEAVDMDVDPNPLAGAGTVELVQDGYIFLEGPVWDPAEGRVLYCDIPASRIFSHSDDGGAMPFRSQACNGLWVDGGELTICEHGGRQVSRLVDDTLEVLTDRFEGDRLNSPNDVVIARDGTLYFTDPPYATPPAELELDFAGVFRLEPSGELSAEWRGGLETRPNGVVISPDQTTLYVSRADDAHVLSFPVQASGALGEPVRFADTGSSPDGMAVDVLGNLYVSTGEGIEIFAPDGTRYGALSVPQTPANCTFGGPDRRTLYITARSALYRVTLPHAGLEP